ncbi:alpha/beta hydrolase [Actinomadura napierensis]|uniref:Esterase family protein n=1 Tax=Actinomadura napierensis TaxID=267854 RepID=A0ABN2YHH4_9ACTN
MRARRFIATTLLLAGTPILLAPRPAEAAPRTPVRFADGAGIRVERVQRIDDRQYAVRVGTAALGRAVDVRILLPTGYERRPTARYPVLYLFHGTNGRAADWVEKGGAEATTAGKPLITVMPDAGFDGDGGGWFTDWADPKTKLGPSKWETFHVGQLVPWIDRNLRTVAARRGRAIAGLSQGGFGAMSYTARHPDMFASATSFSGAPDIAHDPVTAVGAYGVISLVAAAYDGVPPDSIFGSRFADAINWRGHDPATLASNLRGTRLSLYTATGIPGPLDHGIPDPGAVGIEALAHQSTLSFHRRLQQLKIPSRFDDYTFGTHTFPYWARDLREEIGPLMRAFAAPSRPPARVSYASIDRTWTQWGWTISLVRRASREFSGLSDATSTGFTLKAGGTATVTTPPSYRPGARYIITVPGHRITAKATASGRLAFTLRPTPNGRVTTVHATIGRP